MIEQYAARRVISNLLGIVGLLGAMTANAQQTAVVTGQVQDAARQPLPGATVRLLHLPDTTTAAGTQTNATGYYTFSGVAAGRYEVRATAVGAQQAATAPFTLKKMLRFRPQQQQNAVIALP